MHRKWEKKSVCSISNFVIAELDDAFEHVHLCIHVHPHAYVIRAGAHAREVLLGGSLAVRGH